MFEKKILDQRNDFTRNISPNPAFRNSPQAQIQLTRREEQNRTNASLIPNLSTENDDLNSLNEFENANLVLLNNLNKSKFKILNSKKPILIRTRTV